MKKNLPSDYKQFGDAESWKQHSPTVTGLFVCYQQARYVREALLGALSQAVPMQLIVSDDGSTDGTADLLAEIVSAGVGHHQVLLRIGRPNLGLTAHLNELMLHAAGDITMFFAGDDVSNPNRVAVVSDAAKRSPSTMVFGSSFDVVMEHGGEPSQAAPTRPTQPFDLSQYLAQNDFQWIPGAVMAFRSHVFRRFGPLPEVLAAEDITIFLRALMLGSAQFIEEKLITYRIVEGSLSREGSFYGVDLQSVIASHVITLKRVRGLATTLTADLIGAERAGLITRENAEKLRQKIVRPWVLEETLDDAVVNRSRAYWILPAIRSLAVPQLRKRSLRLLMIALLPGAYFAAKRAYARLSRARSSAGAS